MTKHLLRWLCVFLCFPMLSGCWATWSELKKERLLREELEKQFRAFKREQRKERDKQKQIIKEKVLKQAALLSQMHAQQVQLKRKITKLSTTVKRGQGGVVEVFATLQALQKKFESSIGKVTELQKQMTDLVNKQPDIMKSFQELQKRYEVLLTNQKALAEQAIPARLFSRAKDIYKAKKYDEAFKLFKTFTQRFAKHPLTDNALVYIGEIHIRKKQYNQAIGSFSDILEKH
ncbi:MAG TPA: hypothetical protein DCE42_24840, partial [Myxococcales bacterium]|nr:hypothetical protein [Myxococcales bacterium]